MKTWYYELEGPRSLQLREQVLPDAPPAAGEIEAVTEFTVVSPGTEIAAWEGQPPLRPSKVYPRLIGYCNLARVTALGPGVTGLTPGDHVLTHQSHRTAFRCPAAEILLTFPAATPATDQRRLAALYLFHLGHVALLAGDFSPGREVAIIGFGTLGVATAALVRARGGQPVVFTDQPAGIAAQALGLTRWSAKSRPAAPVANLVINTSNRWADHLLALQAARKHGRIVCLGFPGRGQPAPDFNPLDSQYFYDKQLSLHHCGSVPDHATLQGNLAELAALAARGAIDPAVLLTSAAAWRELPAVYAQLTRRAPGQLTTLLTWEP